MFRPVAYPGPGTQTPAGRKKQVCSGRWLTPAPGHRLRPAERSKFVPAGGLPQSRDTDSGRQEEAGSFRPAVTEER
ncbi:MAG TPA: hypothetical protein DCG70_00105 [Lachnoclostridium sp.]|nr:hypothetical protein [Lachnoclostridium sp.]